MGLLDYLLLALIAAGLVGAAVFTKKHGNSCCGDCGACQKQCAKRQSGSKE